MYIEEKLYEETQSSKEELDFLYLEQYLKKEIVIGQLNIDILKTLKLYNKDGYYNVAGELLSDENDIRFSGIDIVRFGDNINQILHRETLTGISLLQQYDKTIETFERYYQLEEIQEYKRVKKELIPKEAFREALANAIVHRNWDINSYIQIGMYHDRIEVLSPGGLPPGISREDYLTKNISVLKNPIIAGVFYRLNLIEKFGTGIGRIVREYEDCMTKPDFVISLNNISVILPIVQTDMSDLIKEEVTIYNLLKENQELSRQYLDTESGFNKSKTLRIINSLLDKNLIEKQGKGVNTTYSKK